MPRYLVSLQAPAIIEGALMITAPTEEEAKELAVKKAKEVIWARTHPDEQKAKVIRSALIDP